MPEERLVRSVDELPIALTVAEAAAVLRISRTTLYELIRRWQATGGAEGFGRYGSVARCASLASPSWSSSASPGHIQRSRVSNEGPAATVGRPEPQATAQPATRLVLSAASRELRRQLSPTAWAVLEEVALDTTREDGVLVAATSSRRIAEHLGLAPSTAASALGQLRRRHLLRLEQRSGPAGRFGLAVYTLGAIPGLSVEMPRAGSPHAVTPCTADEDAAAGVDDSRSSAPLTRRGRPSGEPDQALLDLGWSGS